MYKALLTIFFVGVGIVSSALPVSAALTHNYVCSDFTLTGDDSCVADQIISTVGNGSAYDDMGAAFDLSQAATWYISYDVTGTGHTLVKCTNATCTSADAAVGSYTDVLFTWSSGSPAGLYFQGTNSGTISISNICISDSTGECTPTPPPAPTSTVATSTSVDNPNQDMFFLFVAFWFGMCFIIWLFKRR